MLTLRVVLLQNGVVKQAPDLLTQGSRVRALRTYLTELFHLVSVGFGMTTPPCLCWSWHDNTTLSLLELA